MHTTNPPVSAGTLLRRHWFKLALVAFGLYLFLQKDFSFQINMRAPDEAAPTEAVRPAVVVPAPVVRATPPPAKMTQAAPATIKVTPPPAPLPPARMEIAGPSWGSAATPVGSRAAQVLRTVSEDRQLQFLERFAKVAISEQQKYGVPASVTLANALLHSHGGTRDMTTAGNNYFALTCDAATTDYANYQGNCYRHFNNAWSSFRAHSQYVTTGRFATLRGLTPTDYKAWAIGLEREGFSAEPELAGALVTLIERFGLAELDGAR